MSEDNFISWWSPDPRMVLAVRDFKCSRSLKKTLRQNRFIVRHNTAFDQVMTSCAQIKRKGQSGETWISQTFIEAYSELHRMGYAHSMETFDAHNDLVGGLYGLLIGRFFFGESMFARKTDASKVALAHLVFWLSSLGVDHIDCQQQTAHLASLGAKPVPRADFLKWVEIAVRQKVTPSPHQFSVNKF